VLHQNVFRKVRWCEAFEEGCVRRFLFFLLLSVPELHLQGEGFVPEQKLPQGEIAPDEIHRSFVLDLLGVRRSVIQS
jgi:hypothetical protein